MREESQPDYNNLLYVLNNTRPPRLPLYEHSIDVKFMSKCLQKDIDLLGNKKADFVNYYQGITGFWKEMTYDAFAFEAGVCNIFPDHGAIYGGKLGPIQNRDDFNKYPFDDIPEIFWETYTPHFEAIKSITPNGMKSYGGCGYGIFESCQDLVGCESLCTLQYFDPDLFRDLVKRVGDLYVELWSELIRKYNDMFVFYRMGDDLGFKSSTLLEPDTFRSHFFPQYKRIIDLVHWSGKKFLLHSCGNIFQIMDDLIDLGIDAKHSNEDEIAPFEKWIDLYSKKIGLFGGIDVNILTLNSYSDVYKYVQEKGKKYRKSANGYGLGSGNSIPDYVPVDGYMAMIEAAKEIRKNEKR